MYIVGYLKSLDLRGYRAHVLGSSIHTYFSIVWILQILEDLNICTLNMLALYLHYHYVFPKFPFIIYTITGLSFVCT
jgi:predicted secreted Zn-dependent protease